jgi:hypothetical protein
MTSSHPDAGSMIKSNEIINNKITIKNVHSVTCTRGENDRNQGAKNR